VGCEHTRNECLNSHLFRRNKTDWCPFISMISPITTYGFTAVIMTSLLNIPGYSIDTLEPESKIRSFDTPSISTEIVGCHTPTTWKPRIFRQRYHGHWGEKSCLQLHFARVSLIHFLSDSSFVPCGAYHRINVSVCGVHYSASFLAASRGNTLD